MNKEPGTDTPVVLVADDDVTVRLLARESLEQAGFKVKEAQNGALAVSLFKQARPDIVLLDVMMPEMDGYATCKAMRTLPGGTETPILIITGSDDIGPINKAYDAGANDFVTKPINWLILGRRLAYIMRGQEMFTAFQKSEAQNRALLNAIPDLIIRVKKDGHLLALKSAEEFSHLISDQEINGRTLESIVPSAMAEKLMHAIDQACVSHKMERFDYPFPLNGTQYYYESRIVSSGTDEAIVIMQDITEQRQREAQLEESMNKLSESMENIRQAMRGTIQVISATVETRDPYTAGHQRRVADLARAIATEMKLPEDQVNAIRVAGVIHDLGKISTPAEILSKPTRLTETEFSLIKEHAHTGYEILKSIAFPWPIAEIVYQHHERIDGSGYPRGLKGEDILLEAKIIAVADVVEAMASHRPYRPSLGMQKAIEELLQNRGKLYDPIVTDACVRLINDQGYDFEAFEKLRAENNTGTEAYF